MTPTWLDHTIGWLAPRAALRRVASRHALDVATRAYAGADKGRLTDGWRTSGASADAEIAIAGPVLRDRSRELTRNNPHAAKALASWVNNVVGDGIMPRPATGDATKDKTIKELFDRFVKYCDADQSLDFYGQQQLACREMIEAGEVLLRRRWRRKVDGFEVPLQVQLLEADLLDNSVQGDRNGNTVNQGIEFDKIGRRVAYHLFAQHPGNNVISLTGRTSSAPVPAVDVAHVYENQRTQIRGVPWCTPAMRTLKDIEDWDIAEIIRKKTEASVVAIVTTLDEGEMGIANGCVETASGRKIEKFEPGLIAYARGGKDVKFNAPATVGGYGEYKQSRLRDVAAGYRIPYELLTGDLSQVNFSSIRAGLVEYRRLVKAVQWQIFIPGYCQKVWDWFCEAAWAAGLIPDPVVPVEWSAPKFEWVDPYKDVLADILAIRAGLRTLPEVISESGRNVHDVIAEIVAMNKLLDDNGIILDCDPRQTAKTGAIQVAADGKADGAAPDDMAPATDKTKAKRDDDDTPLLERALAYALMTRNDDGGERALENSLPSLIDAIRSQKAPIVKAPISVNVPPAAPPPPNKATRTVVTKHDANGRILEFERHEIQ